MARLKPFRGIRPRNDLAPQIIVPPYDVLTPEEAKELAKNPNNFVRVTRPEVDLPDGTDPHSERCYAKASENFQQAVADGSFIQDGDERFYCYGQSVDNHRQICILAGVPVEDYNAGLIAKHEFTRPDKEDDRTRHIEALNAQAGLVFLTYRARPELQRLIDRVTEVRPEWSVTTAKGVCHEFWLVPQEMNGAIVDAFSAVERLYIADGHHRSAAAARVYEARQDDESSYFLAGLFPDDQLLLMAYNRVVHDLNGHEPDAFMDQLRAHFDVVPSGRDVPAHRGQVCMYFRGAWHELNPRDGTVDVSDPVARLDVSVVQDRVLGPVLGIEDPRRSKRISFVGGIRGTAALEQAVDSGAAVAFSLYPTGLDQLFDVADSGETMPPKSTWFEPKLFEGVVVRSLRASGD